MVLWIITLVSRAFSLYAELLQLHGQGEQLSDWLSGAAYRIRQLEKPVTDMSKEELAENFRPEIIKIIDEGRKRNSIAKLEELIQLTPSVDIPLILTTQFRRKVTIDSASN